MDLKKVRIVARFELVEALRSRLALVVVGVYGAGAAMGAWIFVRAMQAAEAAARSALAEAMHVPPESLPANLVREKAIPRIAAGLGDEGLREVLLSMDPLGIFYAFAALHLVAGFVLLVSAGTHAADIESGAARYVLFRVDRATWAVGKAGGQAALLALGLLVGALVTGLMGLWLDPVIRPGVFTSLLRASFSAWLYGLSFLGLFAGVSMVASSPLRARGLSFFLLLACSIGHGIVASDVVGASASALSAARWLFPAQYQSGLWFTDVGSFVVSVIGLVGICLAGLSVGVQALRRRDV